MTSTTTDFQITFRDGLTETERRNAERSVAAMVERGMAAAARDRAEEARLAELTAPLNAPFVRLVQEDPAAVEAAEKLRDHDLFDPYATNMLLRDGDPDLAAALLAPRERASVRSSGFAPPYDFTWAWHGGHIPIHSTNKSTGLASVDARSGSIDGGASGFVGTHAGIGVVGHSGPGRKSATAVLRASFAFLVKTFGINSTATSEGGFDVAVFEDGQFLDVADHKLWRVRISANEERHGGDARRFFSNPLTFQLGPDHGYSVNVGVWALTDRENGFGAAAAQSTIEGIIERIDVAGG
ncbi:hypothetical protein ACWGE1_31475 [Streptomyces sp. NPDC054932]